MIVKKMTYHFGNKHKYLLDLLLKGVKEIQNLSSTINNNNLSIISKLT